MWCQSLQSLLKRPSGCVARVNWCCWFLPCSSQRQSCFWFFFSCKKRITRSTIDVVKRITKGAFSHDGGCWSAAAKKTVQIVASQLVWQAEQDKHQSRGLLCCVIEVPIVLCLEVGKCSASSCLNMRHNRLQNFVSSSSCTAVLLSFVCAQVCGAQRVLSPGQGRH